nr:Crp/Fnr family transcriptional regulator [Anaerocolumna cellulosilytica]
MEAYGRYYKKDEYIILAGNTIDFVGLILEGRVFMEKVDYYGNKYFYTEIKETNTFGEVFIRPMAGNCTVNYKAATESSILFIHYDKLLKSCRKECSSHKQVIDNLINLLAGKNRMFMEKIEIISKKSLRDRILTYLALLMEKSNKTTVRSPLNRKEMAEFLCVNRSAMIRELKRLKEEEIIDYYSNSFIIKKIIVK